jgi:hypothetical protein
MIWGWTGTTRSDVLVLSRRPALSGVSQRSQQPKQRGVMSESSSGVVHPSQAVHFFVPFWSEWLVFSIESK